MKSKKVMTTSEFVKLEEEINSMLSQKYKVLYDNGIINKDEIELITDGIINIEKYNNAKIKILWVLQEPYDSDGGGWHIKERIKTAIEKGRFSRDWRIWEKVTYISWAVLNSSGPENTVIKKWDDIPDYQDDRSVINALEEIAYINVKKLPNIKNTRSIPEEIEKAYNFNKEILLKQITEYKPDVVISGNTLRYFYNDLGISDDVLLKPIDKSVTHYCIDKNVLYINAYHPSYGRFWSEDGRKVYCNNILEVIDVFFKNK